jgi:hypothetical protein
VASRIRRWSRKPAIRYDSTSSDATSAHCRSSTTTTVGRRAAIRFRTRSTSTGSLVVSAVVLPSAGSSAASPSTPSSTSARSAELARVSQSCNTPVIGANGTDALPKCTHDPQSTFSSGSEQISRARRVLPIPASPWMTTARGTPATASRTTPPSSSCSAARPAKR